MAVPSGFYKNSAGRGVLISGNEFNVCNKNGEVVVRWEIVGESNGELTLRASTGVTAKASWWKENGKIYLNWNYDTYVHD